MSQRQNISRAALLAAALLSMGSAVQAASAMRVVLDPKTGELRAPTAAEAQAFEKAEAALRAANQSASGKTATKPVGGVEIRYADGTVERTLGEEDMMYSVVSTDEKGDLKFACLPGPAAQKAVKAAGRKPVPAALK